jgi:hypothetical protein
MAKMNEIKVGWIMFFNKKKICWNQMGMVTKILIYTASLKNATVIKAGGYPRMAVMYSDLHYSFSLFM